MWEENAGHTSPPPHFKSLPYYKAVSFLRQYGENKALGEGRQLHSYLASKGFDRDTFLGNLLVQMYGNCGSIDEAKHAFDRIQEPNVYSWTIMVAAYAQNGHLQEARWLFDFMPQRNVVSWTCMVTTYAQNGHLDEAKSLFDNMPTRTVVSWNAMISGYAQNGQYIEALQVYHWMLQEGERANDSTFVSILDSCGSIKALQTGKAVHRSIIESGYIDNENNTKEEQIKWIKVGNALVTMYGSCGEWEESKFIFDKMHCRDVVTWTAMLVAYAKSGHLQEARSTFDDMPEKSLISWSAMIAAYAQLGYNEQALDLFRKMDIEGEHPDGVTFVTMFDVCGDLSALTEGNLLYEEIQGSELEKDVTLVTSLVGMFRKCGKWDTARELFDGMPRKDMVMWTSMISAYAQSGHWLQALETFCLMSLDGVSPNEITFVSVLASCSHVGRLDQGWIHFVSMVSDFDLFPDSRHYVCMVDLLARAGEADNAVELIQNMPFQPDALSWRSAMFGSSSSTKTDQQASDILTLDLDGATYSLLSNIITR